MSDSLPLVTSEGADSGEVPFPESLIERERGEQAVKDTVTAFLNGQRAGTGAAKTRAMLRGGGAKPWRQKGTGRARAGSIRSPLWVGGGVIFPPRPRDFSQKVNKKTKCLAMRRALTARVDEGDVLVVDKLAVSAPKTRELVALLQRIGAGEHTLLIAANGDDENLYLAARNLPEVLLMTAHNCNTYQVLRYKKIVIEEAALPLLEERLGAKLRNVIADDEPALEEAPAEEPEPVAVAEEEE